MTAGGNGWKSDTIQQSGYFLPGTVPTDLNALDRLLFYRRDPQIPKHRLRWNWISRSGPFAIAYAPPENAQSV